MKVLSLWRRPWPFYVLALSLCDAHLCSSCSRRTIASPFLSAPATARLVTLSSHPQIVLYANLTTLQHLYRICLTSPHHLLMHLWRLRVWYHWWLWRAIWHFPCHKRREVQRKAYNSLLCAPNLLNIAAPSIDPFVETYGLIPVAAFESHSTLYFASKGDTTQF